MNKHTKGPWSVPHMANSDVDCDCKYVLSEGYMGSICTISVDNGKPITAGGNDSPPLAEARANAHLIAAAPVLLEALESLIGLYDSGTISDYQLTKEYMSLARAAIKQAKGE